MGYYISDTRDESKELWLERNGILAQLQWMPEGSFEQGKQKGMTLVCLVDNYKFTAAGICYCQEEFDRFNEISDTRAKEWYYVPTEKLIPFCSYLA